MPQCLNYSFGPCVRITTFRKVAVLPSSGDILTLFDAEVKSLVYFETNSTAEINNSLVFTATPFMFYNVMFRHRC